MKAFLVFRFQELYSNEYFNKFQMQGNFINANYIDFNGQILFNFLIDIEFIEQNHIFRSISLKKSVIKKRVKKLLLIYKSIINHIIRNKTY